jgi:hypothetical protein
MYINYFRKNKTFYVFYDIEKFCESFNQLILKYPSRKKEIPNKSWITEGYALPLNELLQLMEGLYEKHDLSIS